MELDKKLIGNRIKKERNNIGLTQEELAQKLGLNNKSSISQYENGDAIPSDDIKFEMSKIFNVSIDYLLGKSDIRNPEITDIDTDKIKIGLSSKDYTHITDNQRKQIEDFARFVLKDNEKKKNENK